MSLVRFFYILQLFIFLSKIEQITNIKSDNNKIEYSSRLHVTGAEDIFVCKITANTLIMTEIDEFYISENNTFQCNQKHIEILYEYRNPKKNNEATLKKSI